MCLELHEPYLGKMSKCPVDENIWFKIHLNNFLLSGTLIKKCFARDRFGNSPQNLNYNCFSMAEIKSRQKHPGERFKKKSQNCIAKGKQRTECEENNLQIVKW